MEDHGSSRELAHAASVKLDTTGDVLVQRSTSGGPFNYLWRDLDAFTQGYIEALFASAYDALFDAWWSRSDSFTRERGLILRFSDLAPETLARIIADCERMAAHPDTKPTWHNGKQFWHIRNCQTWADFPPLTPYLGDDGRVYLREPT